MLTIILWMIILAVAVYYTIIKQNGTNSRRPPGPWGFPILGHLPLLGQEPHKVAYKWMKSKKYPSVISVRFGSIPAVMISDPKLVKEALNHPELSGRPPMKFLKDRSGGHVKGIIFTEGDHWSEQRRFTLRQLRDFGFGKKSLESVIIEEVVELLATVNRNCESPIATRQLFNSAIINALWTILTGQRFQQDDPELHAILDMLITSFENNNVTAAVSMFIPWITTLAPKLSGYEKLIKESYKLADFLNKPIQHHQKTLVEQETRDFIDAYLKEVEKTTNPNSSFHVSQGELTYILMDLFIAGAETLSTTLSWTLLYMSKWPEVQQQLQEEIDRVVGNTRLPSLSDRPNMPYTQAVMQEVMRFSSIAPLGFFHNALTDVNFAGYVIPKGTMIVTNLWACHFDDEIWDEPTEFRPERFLDSKRQFQRNDAFIAFSYGKRQCLGESLARDEYFLFMTGLFQKFTVKSNPEDSLDLSPKIGSVLMPKPHTLLFHKRDQW